VEGESGGRERGNEEREWMVEWMDRVMEGEGMG